MAILIVAIIIGLLPAFIAQKKGRDFVAWWIYGALLFIIALPHALLIKPDVKQIEREKLQSGDLRKCPFCAELIKSEAHVCRFFGRDVGQAPVEGDLDNEVTKRFVDAIETHNKTAAAKKL